MSTRNQQNTLKLTPIKKIVVHLQCLPMHRHLKTLPKGETFPFIVLFSEYCVINLYGTASGVRKVLCVTSHVPMFLP